MVAALVAYALGPLRAGWPVATALVLAAAWVAGSQTLASLREDRGSFPLRRRAKAALSGGAAFALALLVFDGAARLATPWPMPIHYHGVRSALLAYGGLVGATAVGVVLLLPGRLLAAEAADPARAVLGWAAVGALGLFGEMAPSRFGRDGGPNFVTHSAWPFVLSLAFAAGWAAAARSGTRPVVGRAVPARRDEHAAVALVLLVLLGVFMGRSRTPLTTLLVLVAASHLVVLRERLRPHGLRGDVAALGLLALSFGVAVHQLVPRSPRGWPSRGG